MSKAFKKDDGDGADDADGEASLNAPRAPTLPPNTKNYITPSGFKKLRDELTQLLNVDRPKLVEVIAWAASNGDRSENGDYIYGKRKLREIDRRIRFLQKRLEIAEVVDPTQAPRSDRVLFGATVTVLNEEAKKQKFTIVGVDETIISEGRISWLSPMGKALLQSKVGDAVNVRTPQGEHEYEVVAIEYEKN